eukprot:1157378-Pelagomonas_calceolata.AAC.1
MCLCVSLCLPPFVHALEAQHTQLCPAAYCRGGVCQCGAEVASPGECVNADLSQGVPPPPQPHAAGVMCQCRADVVSPGGCDNADVSTLQPYIVGVVCQRGAHAASCCSQGCSMTGSS